MKQAIILGGGIIGLSTAYYLQQEGYQICIIDRNPEVGLETSYANGAQLSYSYVAPLAGPGVLSHVPKWLLNPNSPLKFKPSLNPSDICWGLNFVKACTASQSLQTTKELLALSFLSRDLYHELIPELGEIDFNRAGKLVMHRSQDSFHSASKQLDLQRELGCEQFALDRDACLEKEPALAPFSSQIAGGIYTPSEEVADSSKVCLALKAILEKNGAEFLFNRRVTSLNRITNQRVNVQLDNGEIHEAETIVMALACDSNALLKPLGIQSPVGPLKGYSLTLDIQSSTHAPTVSITDFERKVVYARLGNRLRIAGMADRVGMDRSIDPKRINTLITEAQALFPEAGNYQEAKQWAGLRPATPKGKPIIDQSKYQNLWLNIGHGALGFTLATGSGKLLSDLICQHSPMIDQRPYTFKEVA